MRIYIAGPMTGLPQFNYPAFFEAAERLRALGHEVENPEPPCKTWRGYMRLAIRQLVTCDCAALLPGWEESRGARTERRVAHDLELPAMPLEEMISLLQGTSMEQLAQRLETGAWPPLRRDDVDAEAAINAGFKSHGYRQGTKECIAFYRGATWAALGAPRMRDAG